MEGSLESTAFRLELGPDKERVVGEAKGAGLAVF